jgi:hypothetical protein
MADNRATAMRFLQGKGLTRPQAAGVVGSLMQESGLRTNAKNPSSGALGIGQWLGGRKTNLLNRGNSGSLTGQLNFLWGELQGPENAALKRLRNAGTVGQAVDAFTWGFERPGRSEANIPNRVNQAHAALGLSGNVSPSAGSPGTPGTPGTTITDTHLAFDPGAAQTAPGLKLPARPQPQITAPTAPDFAARAVTPTGYQAPEAPASSPAKAARFDAGQTLEALQALSSGGTKTVKTTATVGGTPGTPASGGSYRSGGAKGSKVLELIFNNGGKGFGIKDGQTVSGSSVFSGVWDGHRNHVHVAAGPQTVVALGKLAQGMGLHVGENPHFGGVDPVHAPNSYHYKGEAIDVSGDAQKMGRFAQAVQRYNRTHKLPG